MKNIMMFLFAVTFSGCCSTGAGLSAQDVASFQMASIMMDADLIKEIDRVSDSTLKQKSRNYFAISLLGLKNTGYKVVMLKDWELNALCNISSRRNMYFKEYEHDSMIKAALSYLEEIELPVKKELSTRKSARFSPDFCLNQA